MNEEVFQSENTEEILDELATLIAVVISESVNIDDPTDLPIEQPVVELFDEVETFGLALAKIHMHYDLKIDYAPYSEFDNFGTIDDVFQYFARKILIESVQT